MPDNTLQSTDQTSSLRTKTQSSLKVLHLFDRLNCGGGETLALDVFKNAKENGLNMEFVSFGEGDLLDKFKSVSRARFHLIKRSLPIDPFTILKLRRLIIQNKFSVIHFHQAVTGLHAWIASLGLNVKLVLSIHGFLPKAKKNNRINKFLINRVNATIAVSNGFLDRLRTQSEYDADRNFHIIYNGVDSKRVELQHSTIKAELGIPAESLLFVMVGNFSPWKDQLTLCKAFKSVLQKNKTVFLVFAGGQSPAYPHLYTECLDFCTHNALLENIRFLGKRSDISNILSGADIFAFSTVEDTFGIALVEAMLLKKPCIASDIGPVKEVTDNGRVAILFRTGDEADLASKIELLVTNPAILEKLGSDAFQWAKENYEIAHHIESLKKLYESL